MSTLGSFLALAAISPGTVSLGIPSLPKLCSPPLVVFVAEMPTRLPIAYVEDVVVEARVGETGCVDVDIAHQENSATGT
jgi:hypothetical protein